MDASSTYAPSRAFMKIKKNAPRVFRRELFPSKKKTLKRVVVGLKPPISRRAAHASFP